jgi:hypothetical protein
MNQQINQSINQSIEDATTQRNVTQRNEMLFIF